jgi:hypothetical protein
VADLPIGWSPGLPSDSYTSLHCRSPLCTVVSGCRNPRRSLHGLSGHRPGSVSLFRGTDLGLLLLYTLRCRISRARGTGTGCVNHGGALQRSGPGIHLRHVLLFCFPDLLIGITSGRRIRRYLCGGLGGLFARFVHLLWGRRLGDLLLGH